MPSHNFLQRLRRPTATYRKLPKRSVSPFWTTGRAVARSTAAKRRSACHRRRIGRSGFDLRLYEAALAVRSPRLSRLASRATRRKPSANWLRSASLPLRWSSRASRCPLPLRRSWPPASAASLPSWRRAPRRPSRCGPESQSASDPIKLLMTGNINGNAVLGVKTNVA